jgi:hypothetical protein
MAHPRNPDDEWQVYAIGPRTVPIRLRVAGHPLHVFRVESIAAIAGAPQDIPLEEALRHQHAVVVALADRFDPILPVRFGARMTAKRITEVIARSTDALATGLAHVRGRRQMTVRVIGPPMPSLAGPASGADYLAQRRAARALPLEARPLDRALAPFVVDRRVLPARGRIRLTIFHLVNREDVRSYETAAKAAAAQIGPWRISLSGPWPPFAFAPELST